MKLRTLVWRELFERKSQMLTCFWPFSWGLPQWWPSKTSPITPKRPWPGKWIPWAQTSWCCPSRLPCKTTTRGVALARMLANDPAVILADEPTGNLDPETADQVIGFFEEFNEEGRTIVMVTHDPKAARRAKRTLNLRDGKIVYAENGKKPAQKPGDTSLHVA